MQGDGPTSPCAIAISLGSGKALALIPPHLIPDPDVRRLSLQFQMLFPDLTQSAAVGRWTNRCNWSGWVISLRCILGSLCAFRLLIVHWEASSQFAKCGVAMLTLFRVWWGLEAFLYFLTAKDFAYAAASAINICGNSGACSTPIGLKLLHLLNEQISPMQTLNKLPDPFFGVAVVRAQPKEGRTCLPPFCMLK